MKFAQFHAGQVIEAGPFELSEQDILDFAKRWDPQWFHTDAKAAADNAAILDTVSKLPYVAFLEGTDKGDTKAKPEIWKNWDKFRAAALKMQEEVTKLSATARTPGLTVEQLKTAVGAVGGTCKGCHDDYRQQ